MKSANCENFDPTHLRIPLSLGHNRTASLHDRTSEWNKNRIIKRTKVMEEIVREKEKELTMHPKINKKSKILAKRRRQQLRQSTSARKKSPVAQTGIASLNDDDEEEDKKPSTIGEALYEDAEAAKDRLDALREDTYRREVPGYPAITRLAAEMIRDGPVSDRLYNHAKVQRRKREEMAAGRSSHHDANRARDLPPNSNHTYYCNHSGSDGVQAKTSRDHDAWEGNTWPHKKAQDRRTTCKEEGSQARGEPLSSVRCSFATYNLTI